MFQDFKNPSEGAQGPQRLAQLRKWMKSNDLQGFIVPRTDRYQGEYVAQCDERLAWLTGFTGSAGFAAVLPDSAGVFVDGRYRLQVKAQVADVFTPVDWPEVQLASWLREHANFSARIGFDPWLHTDAQMGQLRKALVDVDITFCAVQNPIDALWQHRPAPPAAPAFAHDVKYAGQSSDERRNILAGKLQDAGQSAAILTQPDSINWLLNIRGGDVARTPIVQAYAVLHDTGAMDIFAPPAKFAGLDFGQGVNCHGGADFGQHIANLNGPVLIDPQTAPIAIFDILNENGVAIAQGGDLCSLPKAIKNRTEQEGARAAHIRDGAAFCEFLTWLAGQSHAALTEIDVVKSLEGFRAKDPSLHDISFDTICGSGPNGAIVHYRVSEESNQSLVQDSLLLIDSGGQYPDGTTDITRTLAIACPDAEMIASFTRVLQGMIGLSCLRFPKGLAGRDIDALARAPLWAAGQDYAHGTGHGVGSFLSVHEGPQSLSRRATVPLQAGMILSNEPGFYKEGSFGIRIENLILVQESDGMLEFETLTYVPIDKALIDIKMLTGPEREWLNAYHAKVYGKLSGLLSPAAKSWLKDAAAPI